MTEEEVKRSIEMRKNGSGYREIAEVILRENGEDKPVTISDGQGQYPALSHYIRVHYDGNIAKFAKEAKIPKGTMYGVICGSGTTKSNIDKILRATGMSYEEAFSTKTRDAEVLSAPSIKCTSEAFCYHGCPWEISGLPCPVGGKPEGCSANKAYQDFVMVTMECEELHKRLAECVEELVALRMENDDLKERCLEGTQRGEKSESGT